MNESPVVFDQSKSAFSVLPIHTPIFRPGEDLYSFVKAALDSLAKAKEPKFEKLVVAVTSKIISLSENRLRAKSQMNHERLVKEQADIYVEKIFEGCHLTVKNNLLMPNSGVDESNSPNGEYILFPKDPFSTAKQLAQTLSVELKIREIGVIITDSFPLPLRRGTIGLSVGHWGFSAVESFVGKEDLFGRKLNMTAINKVDALAAAAVLAMGETKESTPLCCLFNAPVHFWSDLESNQYNPSNEIEMELKTDLFYPLLKELSSKTGTEGL